MTQTTAFDWLSFLLGWSAEWADSLPADEVRGEDDESARRERWLGFEPASEERIVAAERRLGCRFPPSFRAFLTVSDGWRHAGGFVWRLAGTSEVHWHEDEAGLADTFEECLDEDASPEEVAAARVWRRGLRIDVESDAMYVLMDPEDVDAEGEWAVYSWAGWRAAPPERYAGFGAFMRDMHREFHALRANPADGGPEFVNDTTRRLDAQVDAARQEALCGRWEPALAALEEAAGYGRPRAAGLRDQILRLLGRTYMVYYDGLVADRRYAPELLPLLVAEHAAHSYRDDSTLRFHLRGADEELMSSAYAMLARVRAGAYRYAPGGPFGQAVERAREQARWGDTDGAWGTLRDALPLWEPLGPDHLAPLGWLADPLLGPLFTEERGRELLATPRAGQEGERPAVTAACDPEGLAWLAEPDPGNNRRCYRFVLVEDVAPGDLPLLLADPDDEEGAVREPDTAGADGAEDGGPEGTALTVPMDMYEARQRFRAGRTRFSSFADRALVAVGRAGDRWSFAFDDEPGRFDGERFVSPAVAASADGRAVVVWSGLRTSFGEPYFHLSVARAGAELYAFTYEGGEIRRSGRIPAALDPDRFFGAVEDAAAEGPLLEAIAAEFGVRLPRHALLRGRLHRFTTCSWTRPPRDGETYAVVWMRYRPGS
ncbi:SMI1/KNR4 family protein [Streptomyces sp. NPDC057386]|jgi:hypothetical protein|uniref:SMI1/KNR4 family protein n=1 Tax=Streptomyces thermocoprophilus TaxID=78356 RepID=A0ABV5VJP6_9ACTN